VPKPLGEVVVVHELVHLVAPNHERVFMSFMHAYLPDWEVGERELKACADKAGRSTDGTIGI
jgi:predicted metal-dependent hydrolase